MTTPIPINPHTFTPNTPGDKQSTSPPRAPSHPGGGMTSNSPSSAISISPQTPFFPPPATSQNIGAASPPSANPGFFKWAQAAATLGKSPPPSSADHAQPQRGFDIPPTAHDHDDHENHDSFEFGDFDDLKQRSWTKTRRAVSMSAGPGQGASGITAMLSGFGAGAASPPRTAGPIKEGTAVGAMSMPGSGLLADKAARGQGVLRRLSMSGSSFRGNSFLSPGGGFSASLPSPPEPATAVQPSFTVQQPTNDPPKPDVGVQRAATVSGGTGRGRRYSESGGRKRGVSPMGERILRDHGGF